MFPQLINIDEYAQSLPEISTHKIYLKSNYHPEGLFSEQIFGPKKNYTCQCGKYYGPSKEGEVCSICGVEILHSSVRRERFAKISLPFPIINPIFIDLLTELNLSKKIIDQIIIGKQSVYLTKNEVIISDSKIDNAAEYTGVDAIRLLIENEILNTDSSFIAEHLDKLLIHNVIVIPPDLRPIMEGKVSVLDEFNRYYTTIIMRRNSIVASNLNVNNNKKLFDWYFKQIQKSVNELYNHILQKLSKKEGLVRHNMLGRRIDFSGRAVIVPDPTLKLNECKISYLILMELFKIHLAKHLIYKGKSKFINEAIQYINDCIEYKRSDLYNDLCEIVVDQYAFLNRQPSLHRPSLSIFKIIPTKDEVIKIHPLICPPYNADFDGDQMAIYISLESQKELKRKVITKMLSSPANGSLITTPNQDIVLGIFNLTKTESGFEIFKNLFPSDFEIEYDGPITKKKLIKLLNDVKEKYDEEITKDVIDNVKELGFISSSYGNTLSLHGFYNPKIKEIQNYIFKDTDSEEQLRRISSNDILEKIKEGFAYKDLIESGARGSWDQAKQLILSRGFVSNFKGEILNKPIKHSLFDGLTKEEFFLSTYGSRKGLLDVALNTSNSGYLSRKLIFLMINLELDPNIKDCGTQDKLEIYVENEKKAELLIGKWYNLDRINNNLSLITKENYKDLVGKNIFIRSPIFCKNEKICLTCYGEFYKYLNSRFIGVIAAQSLGEVNTQLVLRTFHTSGTAVIRDVQFKQQDIVNDLSFTSYLLHHYNDIEEKCPEHFVKTLFDIYNNHSSINHVHFECIVSQLMWHKGMKWRLIPNRKELPYEFVSIKSVPSLESWILGLGFENPKRHLLDGIRYGKARYKGIFDRILRGEPLEESVSE
ncbi:MAG: hypothetical protein KatS3mg002_0251 [Candidatus Woesearchaeota archaeon]|nr:MAG: hypothetical protein KatS3mg002_0251 [Candidatus Woesearchaeota archaeon]